MFQHLFTKGNFSQMLDTEWTAKNFKKSANCTQSNKTKCHLISNKPSTFDFIKSGQSGIMYISPHPNFHEFFNQADWFDNKQ